MEENNWVYAGVEPSNRGNAVRLYGILKFDEKGKLITEWSWSITGYTLLRSLVLDDSDAVKRRIVQEMRFNTKPVEPGIDFTKIVLLDKDTFEEFARKAGSKYYIDLNRYSVIKRPLTIYFLPLTWDIDRKIRTERIVVVDANGDIVLNWTDSYGWIVGWSRRSIGRRKEARIVKEYLSSCAIQISNNDRFHSLDPQSIKDKIDQFPVSEELDMSRLRKDGR